MGSGWFRIAAVAGDLGCSWLVERCSSVDGRLGLERELGLAVGSYSSGLVQIDVAVGLELNDHHLGNLGCSIFRHKIHHRTGWTCHIGRRSCVAIGLVDIVAELAEGLAVVVLVERLANGHRWLGIYASEGRKLSMIVLCNMQKAFTV